MAKVYVACVPLTRALWDCILRLGSLCFNVSLIEELHRLELSAPITEMLVGYQCPRWANKLPPANFFRDPALRHILDCWYPHFSQILSRSHTATHPPSLIP